MGRMKIGLMLPLGESEAGGWTNLRAMALAAEEHGLDSVWGADHLIFRDDGETHGIHESWTVLSAVAAVTERVEIGPLVLALPFRNPALTAKMAVELDEVSNGRFTLGLGCGWHEPEFDAFGYPFDHRVGRFDEGMQIITPLLRGESVTFEGRFQRATDAVLRPAPRGSGRPRVLIAGKGPRMLRLVAEHADAWNAAWYGEPREADDLRRRLADLHRALEQAGREPQTLEITAGIFADFGGGGTDDDIPKHALRGSVEEIGHAMARYEELGVTHLIAHIWPRNPDAVARLGEAAALARRGQAVAASSSETAA